MGYVNQFSSADVNMQIMYRNIGSEEWITKDFTVNGSASGNIDLTKTIDVPVGQYEYKVRYVDSNSYSVDKEGAVTTIIPEVVMTGASISVQDVAAYGKTSTNVDIVGAAILCPRGLYRAANNGYGNATVEVRVEYRPVGGDDDDWIGQNLVISERSTSPVRRIVKWEVERGQYDVRAYFSKNPPTGASYVNEVELEYVYEGLKDDFQYPGTSLMAVRALATDQLEGSMPTVKVIASRNYVWVKAPEDDLWHQERADNPAWACYDMIANGRYGGDKEPERINYYEFKAWADYCDEKGYKFAMYFDDSSNLYNAMNHASTVGRGMVIQRGTNFGCIVDRPTDPVQLFTMSNIIEDSFEEVFTQKSERANVIEISYFDRDKDWNQSTIEVRDSSFDEINDEIIRTSVTLYGCPTKAQAMSYGRFLMNQNRLLNRTISFDADVDAIVCTLGDVIYIQHDLPEWGVAGGRVIGASLNSIVLDKEITFEQDTQYAVLIRHNDSDSLETRTIVPYDEETTTNSIVIADVFSKEPTIGSLYSIGKIDSVAKKFRVTKLTKSQDFKRTITCLEYRDDVYADTGEMLDDTTNESNLGDVKSLEVSEVWKSFSNGGRSVVQLSWRGESMAWSVYYRELGSSTWVKSGTTSLPRHQVDGLDIGVAYEFSVCDSYVSPSNGVKESIVLVGKTAPPSDVAILYATKSGNEIVLQWPHIEDDDLFGYIIKQGNSWDNGRTICDLCQENKFKWTPSDSGTYTFWIKSVDTSKIESKNATQKTLSIVLSDKNQIAVVNELTKENPCDGYTDEFFFDASNEHLILISGMTDTTIPEVTDQDVDYYLGVAKLSENYYTTAVKDLGSVVNFVLKTDASFDSEIKSSTDVTISDRTDKTYPSDTDVSVTSFATYDVEFRVSDDNVSWSEWEVITSTVDCRARYFQLRYEAKLNTSTTSFAFDKLLMICDGPDVEYRQSSVPISSEGTTLTLDSLGVKIFINYTVMITPIGSTQIGYTVDKNTDQFTIYLFDSSGNPTSGYVDVYLRGV